MDKKDITQYSNYLVIRKSAIVLLIRIISFELLIGILYLALRIGLRFLDIQLDLELSLDPLSIIKSFLFITIEITVVGFIILKWINNYYILTPFEIKYVTGIFSKREMNYSIKNLQSISYEQGLVGRIFHFGNVKAYSPALQQELFLSEVSNPQQIVENIKDVLEESSNKAQFIMRR